MASDVGRNDRCPCGSGKKYKKCCLLKEQTERPLSREALGRACSEAADLLLEYSLKFTEPLESSPLGRDLPELPDEKAQQALHRDLLSPWTLYLWFPPDAPSKTLPSERTVAARFLKQEGATLDGMTKRYMEAARLEPFSYWQVESVSPGAGVRVKDLLTGEERSVADRSISRSVAKWDILFAQVVGLDGVFILNGMGLYALTPTRFRQAIANWAVEIGARDGKTPDRLALLGHQTEMLNHYLRCVDEMMNPTLPELRNMDGDKLVVAKSRFSFSSAARADVIEALKALRDMHEEDEKEGAAIFIWMAMPKSPGHTDKVVKGRIAVGSGWLESECNSEARDKALRTRLLIALESLLTYESTHLKPFRPGRAGGKSPASSGAKSGAIDLATLSAEDRRSIEAVMEGQYMAWLDAEIPMLGGKTPRATARTEPGKAEVAAMINDWENMQNRERNPQYRFDFNKLRVALQIPLE